MTLTEPSLVDLVPTDPFSLTAPAPAPTRPRLLSHVGRWGRARRWLPAEAMHVLDVGCSFGYGSAGIAAASPPGRVVVGVECDPGHLERARTSYPWLTILDGDAKNLPAPDACADAVILLDVVEHIADPDRVFAEARRVLKPTGVIVVTVPHAGVLGGLDALNLYAALRRIRPSLPRLDAATESDGGPHRHYKLAELERELAPWFVVDRVSRSGLGLQELVSMVMIALRVLLRTPRVARPLMPLHFIVTNLDYFVPMGPFAYNLAVRGRVKSSSEAVSAQ